MKVLLLGISVAIGMTAATAAMAETPLMAPIHQFIDNFDKGDVKTAAKAFAPTGVAIIDEVPPHSWVGAHALQQWSKDLDAVSKKAGFTDEAVTLGATTREDVNGDRGYVVVPRNLHLQGTRHGDARAGADGLRAEERSRALAHHRLDLGRRDASAGHRTHQVADGYCRTGSAQVAGWNRRTARKPSTTNRISTPSCATRKGGSDCVGASA